MVLESTFICVDNSEYMRNGDFLPTRLQAQQDAVSIIAQSKLRSNPESNVGLMTLGSLEVLVTLTTDSGKIMAQLHGVQPKGDMMLVSGIKIAHLALKHRLSKNHKTRIVAFVGSPVGVDEKELVKLAKKLKKEKVSVDVISFGEVDANENLLKKFVETVNGKDGTASHLVAIPPGPHLSDALISSPILQGEDGAGGMMMGSGGVGGAGGGGGFEFGVDPNEDPELALALRVSMEEQRARQEQQSAGTEGPKKDDKKDDKEDQSGKDGGGTAASNEEALLEKALKMSMETTNSEPDLASMTEEEQIAYAMKMSMQGGGSDDYAAMEVDNDDDEEKAASTSKKAAKEGDDDGQEAACGGEDEDYSEAMNDPAFLQSVLESLPGVDPQSEAVKQAMGAMAGNKGKKKADEKDKSKKDDDEDEDDDVEKSSKK